MTHRLHITLLFVLCCASAAGIAEEKANQSAAERGVLRNGGFEKGLTAPWGTGQYSEGHTPWWNSGGCLSTAVLDTSVHKGGKASLHLVNTSLRGANVFGTTAQRVSIQPDTTYRIIFWAKGKDLASAGALNIAVDPEWRVRPIAIPAGSFDWQRFEGSFSLPDSTADVRILFEDRGEVWIDDVRIVPQLKLAALDTGGMSWDGRDGDGWDFTLYEAAPSAADGITFTYAAQHVASGDVRHGKFSATIFGRHLKAVLTDVDGKPIRGYDGTLSADRRFVWGTVWPLPGAGPDDPARKVWWATIEKERPQAPGAARDLNAAGVAEFEAIGISSRSARTLVEGRLFGSPYRSVDEASAAPGLTPVEKEFLKERFHAP